MPAPEAGYEGLGMYMTPTSPSWAQAGKRLMSTSAKGMRVLRLWEYANTCTPHVMKWLLLPFNEQLDDVLSCPEEATRPADLFNSPGLANLGILLWMHWHSRRMHARVNCLQLPRLPP